MALPSALVLFSAENPQGQRLPDASISIFVDTIDNFTIITLDNPARIGPPFPTQV